MFRLFCSADRAVWFSQDFFLQEFSHKATPEMSCQVLPQILSLARLSVRLTQGVIRMTNKSYMACVNRTAPEKLLWTGLQLSGLDINWILSRFELRGWAAYRKKRVAILYRWVPVNSKNVKTSAILPNNWILNSSKQISIVEIGMQFQKDSELSGIGLSTFGLIETHLYALKSHDLNYKSRSSQKNS